MADVREPASPLGISWSPAVVVLAAILLLLIVPPAFYLLKTSFYTTNPDGSFGDFTFDYYRDLFDSPRFLSRFINSSLFALGAALLAIILGATLAWIVERTDTPLRQYAFLISIISLGIPHVLYTAAWLLVLGRRGPVNLFLMDLLGSDAPLITINSLGGMILVEGLIWTPLGFLLLSAVFRSADTAFEEAALMSGASIRTAFLRITLRLATPALLALLLLKSSSGRSKRVRYSGAGRRRWRRIGSHNRGVRQHPQGGAIELRAGRRVLDRADGGCGGASLCPRTESCSAPSATRPSPARVFARGCCGSAIGATPRAACCGSSL